MEELVREGLVRSIGCCNISPDQIRQIHRYANVKPSVLQVEIHPYLVQRDIKEYCKKKNIALTAYSSFGAGGYVEMGRADPQDQCWNE